MRYFSPLYHTLVDNQLSLFVVCPLVGHPVRKENRSVTALPIQY